MLDIYLPFVDHIYRQPVIHIRHSGIEDISPNLHTSTHTISHNSTDMSNFDSSCLRLVACNVSSNSFCLSCSTILGILVREMH